MGSWSFARIYLRIFGNYVIFLLVPLLCYLGILENYVVLSVMVYEICIGHVSLSIPI